MMDDGDGDGEEEEEEKFVRYPFSDCFEGDGGEMQAWLWADLFHVHHGRFKSSLMSGLREFQQTLCVCFFGVEVYILLLSIVMFNSLVVRLETQACG